MKDVGSDLEIRRFLMDRWRRTNAHTRIDVKCTHRRTRVIFINQPYVYQVTIKLLRSMQQFPPNMKPIVLCFFFGGGYQGSRASNSKMTVSIWPKLQLPKYYACPDYLQIYSRSNQKQMRQATDKVKEWVFRAINDNYLT